MKSANIAEADAQPRTPGEAASEPTKLTVTVNAATNPISPILQNGAAASWTTSPTVLQQSAHCRQSSLHALHLQGQGEESGEMPIPAPFSSTLRQRLVQAAAHRARDAAAGNGSSQSRNVGADPDPDSPASATTNTPASVPSSSPQWHRHNPYRNTAASGSSPTVSLRLEDPSLMHRSATTDSTAYASSSVNVLLHTGSGRVSRTTSLLRTADGSLQFVSSPQLCSSSSRISRQTSMMQPNEHNLNFVYQNLQSPCLMGSSSGFVSRTTSLAKRNDSGGLTIAPVRFSASLMSSPRVSRTTSLVKAGAAADSLHFTEPLTGGSALMPGTPQTWQTDAVLPTSVAFTDISGGERSQRSNSLQHPLGSSGRGTPELTGVATAVFNSDAKEEESVESNWNAVSAEDGQCSAADPMGVQGTPSPHFGVSGDMAEAIPRLDPATTTESGTHRSAPNRKESDVPFNAHCSSTTSHVIAPPTAQKQSGPQTAAATTAVPPKHNGAPQQQQSMSHANPSAAAAAYMDPKALHDRASGGRQRSLKRIDGVQAHGRGAGTFAQPPLSRSHGAAAAMSSASAGPPPSAAPTAALSAPPFTADDLSRMIDEAQAVQQKDEASTEDKSSSADGRCCPPGWQFSLYDAMMQQHYVIPSEQVALTRGAARYTDLYKRYGNQTRFRFQLCNRYLHHRCLAGMECAYIHSHASIARATTVHVNENSVTNAGVRRRNREELGGGHNSLGYATLKPGAIFAVYPPNELKSAPQLIPSEMLLRTEGAIQAEQTLTRDAFNGAPTATKGDGAVVRPRHCAHFQFKRMCNLGAACHFVHSLVPFVQGQLNQPLLPPSVNLAAAQEAAISFFLPPSTVEGTTLSTARGPSFTHVPSTLSIPAAAEMMMRESVYTTATMPNAMRMIAGGGAYVSECSNQKSNSNSANNGWWAPPYTQEMPCYLTPTTVPPLPELNQGGSGGFGGLSCYDPLTKLNNGRGWVQPQV